jgi:predicted Zn-dependent peptidase
VPKNHKDAEALQLLDMILDNRTAGLINLNLVQQQQVRDAGSSPSQLNDYGTQYLYGIPKKDQTLAEVEQLLLDQIEIIKRGEFEDWILDAIITDFKKGQKGGLESNTSRAATLRNAFLEFTDWDHKVAEISRMEKITKADVVRVANQYFASNYAAVYRIDEQAVYIWCRNCMITPATGRRAHIIERDKQNVWAIFIHTLCKRFVISHVFSQISVPCS